MADNRALLERLDALREQAEKMYVRLCVLEGTPAVWDDAQAEIDNAVDAVNSAIKGEVS